MVQEPELSRPGPTTPTATGLAASLKACDEKLAEVRKKLGLLANHARRAEYETLFHQLQGARDQIFEAA